MQVANSMRNSELESWVLRISDKVADGQPVEDSCVELKAEWPSDHAKTARLLAGHWNAARGEPVLLIIGLDEKRGIVGASNRELSDWMAQINSHIQGVEPDLLRSINIERDGKTLVALLFDTNRAPYVVKNPEYGKPGGGRVELEVPWRSANATRSARREDLIRLLVPVAQIPEVTIISADLTYHADYGSRDSAPYDGNCWRLRVFIYVVPKSCDRIVIPFHQCTGQVSVPRTVDPADVTMVAIGAKDSAWERGRAVESESIRESEHQVLFDGPSRAILYGGSPHAGSAHKSTLSQLYEEQASFALTLRPAGSDRSITLAANMAPSRLDREEKTVTWRST